MSRNRPELDCKLYVGDLARDTTEKDLERPFSYYGRLRNVWVAQNPAGFAFVEFEDSRDAEDAVRGLDGTNLNGCRIRVEHSSGKVRPKPWLRGGARGGGGGGGDRGRSGGRAFQPDDRCYECGELGHYAYDCNKNKRGGGSRGRRMSRSRSRSRSRSHKRSYSRSRSRSRSRRNRSVSPSRVSRSRVSRSRSRSPVRNNDD